LLKGWIRAIDIYDIDKNVCHVKEGKATNVRHSFESDRQDLVVVVVVVVVYLRLFKVMHI